MYVRIYVHICVYVCLICSFIFSVGQLKPKLSVISNTKTVTMISI